MLVQTIISKDENISFLKKKYGSGVTDISILGNGAWSHAYSFVYDSNKYVIRWSKFRENFDRDALASTYSHKDFPIPHILEIGKEFGKNYAISQFVSGTYVESLSATELEKTLPSLLSLFSAMQNVNLSQTVGYGSWNKYGKGANASWKEFLLDVKNDYEGTLIHGWKNNLINSSFDISLFDQLYEDLKILANKCTEDRFLIHSDLLNFNLLVKDNKVSAVLDWGSSKYGDCLYDLAWFVFYAPWFPQFQQIQLCERLINYFKSSLKNVENFDSRLLCCQLHIGIDSIAYNAYRKDWKAVQKVAEYTLKIARSGL